MSAKRSSLHPEALVAKALVHGTRIICFNIYEGIMGEFVVQGHPIVQESGRTIELRDVESEKVTHRFLNDMGAEAYADGRFNEENFVVPSRCRHLLPAPMLRGYPQADFS